MRDKKQVIILMGPPGAGKGTQAELLSDKLGFSFFESSKVGETAINQAKKGDFITVRGKKYFFEKQKQLWKKGILWDPPFFTYLAKKKIKELHEAGESLVMTGSPRTLYEAKEVIPLLEKLYGKNNIKIILIEVSAKESIFRNSHRRICQLLRHPILYSPETAKLKRCPLDGSMLLKRKGLDDPATIRVRLKEYRERTLPLIEYYETRGLKIKKVNGKGSVSAVFDRVLKALK